VFRTARTAGPEPPDAKPVPPHFFQLATVCGEEREPFRPWCSAPCIHEPPGRMLVDYDRMEGCA